MNDVEVAKRRVQEFINRSGGQHLRAMRAKREAEAQKQTETLPKNINPITARTT